MKWLVLLAALPLLLLAGGLLLNRPPLLAAPGLLERLKVYLTTHVAETRPEHPFPELRTPRVAAKPGEAHTAVVAAMRELGWQEIQVGPGEIRAVVVSTLFRFRDDVSVRIEPTADGSLLHARSASRLGQGDLAANARHLRDLFTTVERLVRES